SMLDQQKNQIAVQVGTGGCPDVLLDAGDLVGSTRAGQRFEPITISLSKLQSMSSVGVLPNSFTSPVSAPCFSKSANTSRCPPFAAKCKGVFPISPLAFT